MVLGSHGHDLYPFSFDRCLIAVRLHAYTEIRRCWLLDPRLGLDTHRLGGGGSAKDA